MMAPNTEKSHDNKHLSIIKKDSLKSLFCSLPLITIYCYATYSKKGGTMSLLLVRFDIKNC